MNLEHILNLLTRVRAMASCDHRLLGANKHITTSTQSGSAARIGADQPLHTTLHTELIRHMAPHVVVVGILPQGATEFRSSFFAKKLVCAAVATRG